MLSSGLKTTLRVAVVVLVSRHASIGEFTAAISVQS
jgi:hypothetical protein